MKRISFVLLFIVLSIFTLQARRVKGTVKCGNIPIAGVLVTDGNHFTKTNVKGTFKFDIDDDAWFVSVVTPSGFTADYSSGAPEFYKKAEGNNYFSFQLLKTSDSLNYTLFSVSDPQMQNEKHFKKFTGAPLKDLKEQALKGRIEGLTAGIALGDLAWDNLEMLPMYKDAIKTTEIPFYAVIGNHDFDKNLKGKETARYYCDNFGPYNYAFFLGGDLVIGTKSIIYDTNKQYKGGYTEEELRFVTNLLKNIPITTHIYIAQHAPLYEMWSGHYIENGDKMLELLKGRKVDFLSGHTHLQNNFVYSEDIMEHNAPSICGSWWITKWCRDGSPRGYEIFTSKDGVLSWVFHPIDYSEDFQVKINAPGQCLKHPNAVVANIWDYDPHWTVQWYQDNKFMGNMTQVDEVDPIYCKEINDAYKDKEIPAYKRPKENNHYFAAVPDQYAKVVTIEVRSPFGKHWTYTVDLSRSLDVQAHRGGAGLMPENTFSSMKNAINLGVNTLEMDLQVSADGKIVVSHDRFFHPRYSIRPDGTPVLPGQPKEYLYTMPYDSIAKYEVGLKPSTVWPEKKNISERKPLAKELISFIENYTKVNSLTPMRYNIEIKSSEGKGEGKNWPEYHEFADKCIELLKSFNLGSRLVVQCFDTRTLNYIHEKYPDIILSYLTDVEDTDWNIFMGKLNFVPTWLSPNYKIVDKEFVEQCHARGMKIVPWTCDDPAEMKKQISYGIDGLITNYPDRLLKITRGY